MKKYTLMLMVPLVLLALSNILFGQMTVKDDEGNVMMVVSDEGTVGSIMLPPGTAPATTTSKLYNVNDTLLPRSQALPGERKRNEGR